MGLLSLLLNGGIPQTEKSAQNASPSPPSSPTAAVTTAEASTRHTRFECVEAIFTDLGSDLPGEAEWLREQPDLLAEGRALWLGVEKAVASDATAEIFELALSEFARHYRQISELYATHIQNAAGRVLEGSQPASGQAAGEVVHPSYRWPEKPCWADGFKCPGCAGTWGTEAYVAEHMRQCPLCAKGGTE